VFLVRVPSATIQISRTFNLSVAFASCVSYVATVADVAGLGKRF